MDLREQKYFDFNDSHFTDPPQQIELLVSYAYEATVGNDNAYGWGLIIGIPPGKNHFSYAGKKVLVRQHLDGSWSVWSNKQKVAQHAPTELRCEKLEGLRPKEAAKKVRDSIGETLTYLDFPREHSTRIQTTHWSGS